MSNISTRIVMKMVIGVGAIIAATLWSYQETINNSFVWDTKDYLFTHGFWISRMSIHHIIWMFLSLEVSNWHPLTWLSWAIDYQLYGGLAPWGYHLSNNILHALNSVLVYVATLVVLGLNDSKSLSFPIRTDNHALIAAFIAALLFAVHPQHVESVAWVAERKDLLCQLFLLSSFLTYVGFVTCQNDARSLWRGGALSLFILAAMSKPMAVTFPAVLLLIDVFPLRRLKLLRPVDDSIAQLSIYDLIREKIPFFLVSIFLVLITIHAQQGALSNIPLDLRILNASNSIIFYLTKLLIPLNFMPFYPYFIGANEVISINHYVPLFCILGITMAGVLAWVKGYPAWLVAWLFYLITLSPVLGLIQVGLQGAADRYAYFPTLPVYFLIGSGVLAALDRTNLPKKILLLFSLLSLSYFLADKTIGQTKVWKNDYVLWTYALKYDPENFVAHMNLGTSYLTDSDYKKAILHFEKGRILRPNQVDVFAWIGLAYMQEGRYEEAITSHINLGIASESLPQLNADQFCIQYNIGWLYANLGMFAESSDLFSRVGKGSSIGAGADTWLDWIGNTSDPTAEMAASSGLPGFCKTLIPAMKTASS